MSVLKGLIPSANSIVDLPFKVFPGDNTGATDVGGQINAFVEANPGYVIWFRPGTYYIGTSINPAASLLLQADGQTATFIYDNDVPAIEYDPGSAAIGDSETAVSAITTALIDLTDYVTRITVADASGYVPGDYAHIYSNDTLAFAANAWAGESFQVLNVDPINNYIYVNGTLSQAALYVTTPIVHRFRQLYRVYIDGIKFSYNPAAGEWDDTAVQTRLEAVTVYGIPYATVRNCRFEKLWGQGVILRTCPMGLTEGNEYHDLPNIATSFDAAATEYTIIDITQAAEAVVTTSAPPADFSNGEVVFIRNVGGMTQINDLAYFVSDLSGSTFKLKNYRGEYLDTTGYSAYTTGGGVGEANVSGLGYGVSIYGASYGAVVRKCRFSQCRHAVTTDGRRSSYSTANWYRYGQPTYFTFEELDSYDAWGVPIDTHEEGADGTIRDVTVKFPARGPQGGSYTGYGMQIRCKNMTIENYTQNGGTFGVRVADVEQDSVSQHFFNNITVQNLSSSADTDTGFVIDDQSAITNKPIINVDNLTLRNVGVGISAGATSTVNVGRCKMIDFDSGVQCRAGSNVHFDEVSTDFRYQTRTGSTHHFALMYSDGPSGGSTCVIGAMDNIQGSGSNFLAAVFQQQDTTATKNYWIGSFREENPSGVTASAVVQASATTILQLTTMGLSKYTTPKSVTNSTYTTLRADSGKPMLMNRATGQTVTLDAKMPVGWATEFIQIGAGATTLTAGAGATLTGASLTISASDRLTVVVSANADGASAVFNSVYTPSGALDITKGGTGQVTQTAAFDALSPTTTKGDIIVSDGTDNIRLGVGTDGFLPLANANETAGLEWVDSPVRPTMKAGRILVPFCFGAVASFSHLTANLYTVPVYVKKRTTFTGIAFGVNTAATNLNVKVGVYLDSGGQPGAIIAGTTATGGPYTDAADTSHTVAWAGPQTLDPGWYWVALQTDQNQSLKACNSSGVYGFYGASDMITNGCRFSIANTYASGLPDPFGTMVYSENSAPTYLGLVLQ